MTALQEELNVDELDRAKVVSIELTFCLKSIQGRAFRTHPFGKPRRVGHPQPHCINLSPNLSLFVISSALSNNIM